jgi:hypothetical protein
MDTYSPVQQRFETYLTRAEEAREIALSLNNADHRRIWEAIADDWQRMAEQMTQELRRH